MQRSLPAFDPVDVVVLVRKGCTDVRDCLRSVLDHRGQALGRLLVLDASGESSVAPEHLKVLGGAASRLETIPGSPRVNFAALVNLGLGESRADTVVMSASCRVYPGWLEELRAAAWLEERTVCVSPVSLGAAQHTVTEREREDQRRLGALAIRDACASLPRTITIPIVDPACVYFKRTLRLAVGALDETLNSPEAVLADWTMRAQRLGFMAKRANRVFMGQVAGNTESLPERGENHNEVADRHPQLAAQVRRFRGSFDDRVAEHAVRLASGERIRVALDLRHLPPVAVGTRTLGICLTQALFERPEIDLTILVREPGNAQGLPGRIVLERDWADDVQVIHRPAQVGESRDLNLQIRSSAHIIITYLDLIAYRTPLVFPTDKDYEDYRVTSNLSAMTAQRLVAMSENAAWEISAEFGIPREEVPVVTLGVESERFAERKPNDSAILRGMHLPSRFLLSVATDFHHKNLEALIQAHDLLRERLGDQTPVLLLVGNRHGGRSAFYPSSRSGEERVHFLGSVTDDQLRVLYQNATALVYPSLYEGFGLPPLEAMAAGTPVIAMPVSSVPEVAGTAACYPDDLSIGALARAMERIAGDAAYREELIARGRAQVARYRWDRMAEEMVEVYRSAILYPSHRSLELRRQLADTAIGWSRQWAPVHWNDPLNPTFPAAAAPGIKASWYQLKHAVRNRIKREIRRLPLVAPAPTDRGRLIPIPKFQAVARSRSAPREENSVNSRDSA